MNRREYLEMIENDVRRWIKDNIDSVKEFLKDNGGTKYSDAANMVYDECLDNDGVTGNKSGSYYCNAYKAESAISHAWDVLADMVCDCFIDNVNPFKGAEYYDVCIRCYLLCEAINNVLDEMGEYEYEEVEEDEV